MYTHKLNGEEDKRRKKLPSEFKNASKRSTFIKTNHGKKIEISNLKTERVFARFALTNERKSQILLFSNTQTKQNWVYRKQTRDFNTSHTYDLYDLWWLSSVDWLSLSRSLIVIGSVVKSIVVKQKKTANAHNMVYTRYWTNYWERKKSSDFTFRSMTGFSHISNRIPRNHSMQTSANIAIFFLSKYVSTYWRSITSIIIMVVM